MLKTLVLEKNTILQNSNYTASNNKLEDHGCFAMLACFD